MLFSPPPAGGVSGGIDDDGVGRVTGVACRIGRGGGQFGAVFRHRIELDREGTILSHLSGGDRVAIAIGDFDGCVRLTGT
ncbi:hypothetical protein C8233_17950 [Halomonas sp. SF2003]|nr:hypothetical protein C8233_17950 [Halomonas sp. SF2003]